jgi:membrane associated rhomboid family serine protease
MGLLNASTQSSDMLFNDKLSWEMRLFFHSLIFPAVLVFLMFTVKLVEYTEGISLAEWGINPRNTNTLMGIVLAPMIHGDWSHLLGNLPSLFVLMVLLNYFYRGLAFRTVIITWLFTGIFVWLAGRESYHIGSSGIIYGLATFLLFSGMIRNHIPLMAITLVVVFLYGSLIWGIFPFHIN